MVGEERERVIEGTSTVVIPLEGMWVYVSVEISLPATAVVGRETVLGFGFEDFNFRSRYALADKSVGFMLTLRYFITFSSHA